MLKLNTWLGGIALALGCSAAGAGMHQICYEGAPEYKNGAWVPNGVFGCDTDGVGYCTISPATSGFISRSNPYPLAYYVQSGGYFRYFDFSSSAGTFTARIDFFDANSVLIAQRNCTVNARGVYSSERGHASPGAVLTGFSTDSSGLVSSGVWRLQNSGSYAYARLNVQAPADFVAVGGGAMGVEWPVGALVTESAPSTLYAGDFRTWKARTAEGGGAAQSHRTTAYVIGLRIEGIASRDLAPLLIQSTGLSNPGNVSVPTSQATQPVLGGSVVIGGGFDARATSGVPLGSQVGQFGTVSAPLAGSYFNCTLVNGFYRCRIVSGTIGWRAESKDHVIAAPGSVTSTMLALPPTLTVGGVTYQVLSQQVSATSAVAAHPAVDVGGLRGSFALTGIGATVDWRTYGSAGNLLWKLEPRADLGGASVASKDHVISSPATVTGHAIGIRLAPAAPATPFYPCLGC